MQFQPSRADKLYSNSLTFQSMSSSRRVPAPVWGWSLAGTGSRRAARETVSSPARRTCLPCPGTGRTLYSRLRAALPVECSRVQRVIRVVAMIKGHFGGYAAIIYNVSLVESYSISGYFQRFYIITNGLSFSNLYFNFTNDSCRLSF